MRTRSTCTASLLAVAFFVFACAPAIAARTKSTGAVIVKTAIARERPTLHAHAVQRVWSYTGFSKRDAVLPVIARAKGSRGETWLHVRLPARPNGATGWIPASRTKIQPLHWRAVVDLSEREVSVYRDGRLRRRFRVVVGKPSTPTPVGRFFVIDRVRLDTWWAAGSPALMLSAYSEFFQATRFDPGEIAFHSRGVLTDPLGSAASHGCIRFSDAAIAWLVRRLPNGTPVDIHR